MAPKDFSCTQNKWSGELSLPLCFPFAWLVTELSIGVRCSVVSLCDVMTHKMVSLLSEQEQKYGLLPYEKALMCCWVSAHDSCQDNILAKQAAKAFWIPFLQTASNCKCSQDIRLKESNQSRNLSEDSTMEPAEPAAPSADLLQGGAEPRGCYSPKTNVLNLHLSC